ncbi:hypothetical protein H632_c618p1 [Helicosporidium sp. ATCC 50920]|nr:hypothetical protein H632_c618p1 [Helicosporidium sp. ATCC 50920]|eukprot:KDD75559.1 hypothetical protein H632_c618p1 [Helicosporidium sp. ATCC 50920]
MGGSLQPHSPPLPGPFQASNLSSPESHSPRGSGSVSFPGPELRAERPLLPPGSPPRSVAAGSESLHTPRGSPQAAPLQPPRLLATRPLRPCSVRLPCSVRILGGFMSPLGSSAGSPRSEGAECSSGSKKIVPRGRLAPLRIDFDAVLSTPLPASLARVGAAASDSDASTLSPGGSRKRARKALPRREL